MEEVGLQTTYCTGSGRHPIFKGAGSKFWVHIYADLT